MAQPCRGAWPTDNVTCVLEELAKKHDRWLNFAGVTMLNLPSQRVPAFFHWSYEERRRHCNGNYLRAFHDFAEVPHD
jgi:hypothetical protein